MKTQTSRLLLQLVLLSAVGVACGSAPPAVESPTPATVEAPSAPAADDYNGTYTTGDGATLTITNYVADKSFNFQLTIKSDDDCDGVDYKEAATFSKPGFADSNSGGKFDFFQEQETLKFEPDVAMIGMECARTITTAYTKVP